MANTPTDIASLVTNAANKYGVDPNLALAVATQESGLNANAISSAGAIGVMQLMPSTAVGLGVNPNDVYQNIDGGVKYLSQLLNQFNGDISLALAGYNAGPGNVAKYNGIPPFPETQSYVSKILNALGIGGSSVTGDTSGVVSADSNNIDISSNISSSGIGEIAKVVLIGLVAGLVLKKIVG